MIVYILLVALVLISYFLTKKYPDYQNRVLQLIILLLIIMAGFRGEHVDKDYGIYIDLFTNSPKDYDLFNDKEPIGYFFRILHDVFNLNVIIFFFSIAAFSLIIKYKAITSLTDKYFLSFFLYVCLYFFLHEMTQIRTGVATGIMLLAIPDIYNKNATAFFSKILLACLFHYSIIVFGLCYFLTPQKIPVKTIIVFAAVALISLFLKIDILQCLGQFNIPVLTRKIEIYSEIVANNPESAKINFINTHSLIHLSCLVVFFIYREKMQAQYRYFSILFQVYFLGFFAYLFFSSIPVFAFRFKELFGFVEIILIPQGIYLTRYKWLAEIAIILAGLSLFYVYLFRHSLLEGYFL